MCDAEGALQQLCRRDETGQLSPRLHSLRMKSGLLKAEMLAEFVEKREGI